jgi:hypothetical protein
MVVVKTVQDPVHGFAGRAQVLRHRMDVGSVARLHGGDITVESEPEATTNGSGDAGSRGWHSETSPRKMPPGAAACAI